jgi:hypothetical protein
MFYRRYFRAQNWDNIAEEASKDLSHCTDLTTYGRMLPGLRLASLILEYSMPFFAKYTLELTTFQIEDMKAFLDELAETTLIYFSRPGSNAEGKLLGLTRWCEAPVR